MPTRSQSLSGIDPEVKMDIPVTMGAISKLFDEKFEESFDRKLQPMLSRMEERADRAEDISKEALTKANAAESEILSLKMQLSESKSEIKSLKTYVTGLDNYSRRDCMNIYGVPEQGGEDCTQLAIGVFRELGVPDAENIKLTRAHRHGRYTKPAPAASAGRRAGAAAAAPRVPLPRAIIIKFHFYPDLEKVYTQRNEKRESGYRLTRVYAPEVEANRRILYPVVSAAYDIRNSLPTDKQNDYKLRFKEDKFYINNKCYTTENISELPPNLHPRALSTTETDTHVYFWGNQSPFSNHFIAPFQVGDACYNCTEQYIMEKRALLFRDTATAARVMAETDPVKQKGLGRETANFRPEIWYKQAKVMAKKGIKEKFMQNPELLGVLKATKTKCLAEASKFDKFWGIGLSLKDTTTAHGKDWKGENTLGMILQEVRDEC